MVARIFEASSAIKGFLLNQAVDLLDEGKQGGQRGGNVQIIIHGCDKTVPDIINELIDFRICSSGL